MDLSILLNSPGNSYKFTEKGKVASPNQRSTLPAAVSRDPEDTPLAGGRLPFVVWLLGEDSGGPLWAEVTPAGLD